MVIAAVVYLIFISCITLGSRVLANKLKSGEVKLPDSTAAIN